MILLKTYEIFYMNMVQMTWGCLTLPLKVTIRLSTL